MKLMLVALLTAGSVLAANQLWDMGGDLRTKNPIISLQYMRPDFDKRRLFTRGIGCSSARNCRTDSPSRSRQQTVPSQPSNPPRRVSPSASQTELSPPSQRTNSGRSISPDQSRASLQRTSLERTSSQNPSNPTLQRTSLGRSGSPGPSRSQLQRTSSVPSRPQDGASSSGLQRSHSQRSPERPPVPEFVRTSSGRTIATADLPSVIGNPKVVKKSEERNHLYWSESRFWVDGARFLPPNRPPIEFIRPDGTRLTIPRMVPLQR